MSRNLMIQIVLNVQDKKNEKCLYDVNKLFMMTAYDACGREIATAVIKRHRTVQLSY